jgi:hypothetical protein
MSGLGNFSINFFIGKFFFSQKRNTERCKHKIRQTKRMQRDHKELSFKLSLPKVLSLLVPLNQNRQKPFYCKRLLGFVSAGKGKRTETEHTTNPCNPAEQEAENETKAKDRKLTWCRAVPFSLSLRIVSPEEKRLAISPN